MSRPVAARTERILYSSLGSSSLATPRSRASDQALALATAANAVATTSAQADCTQLWHLSGEVARLVDGPNPWSTERSRKTEREQRLNAQAHVLHARTMGLELERYRQPRASPPRPPADRRPSADVNLPPHMSPSLWLPSDSSLALQETPASPERSRPSLLGQFSRPSLRAGRKRRLSQALHAIAHSDLPSVHGVTDDDWQILRALVDAKAVNSSFDGNALADLVKLGTLDAELASVSPVDEATADPDDFQEQQALLGLFLERYISLPTFVSGLRQTTVRRLFDLGLKPTLDIAEQLLSAAFERRLDAKGIIKEVDAILGQLRRCGVGREVRERELLLQFVLERYRRSPIGVAAAAAPAILALERELDRNSERKKI